MIRDEHPAVPHTPAELARAAVAAVRAGCARTPVGVSTGLWITGGDVDARFAAVARWAALPAGRRPDVASVNAELVRLGLRAWGAGTGTGTG